MSVNAPSYADGRPPSPEGGLAFGHFIVPRRPDGRPWELGSGAMGVTYRAFDTSLRTEVALKVINAARVQEESVRRRFQREARAAAKIRHPNVASVLYLGEQSGEFFYAMEFIQGRSLDSLLKESAGPLPPAVAVGLAAQAAAALNAAHKREVVHRDLKPANLMLLEADALDHEDERTEAAGKRQLKMIDFGLARSFGVGREDESLVTQAFAGFIGTPAYASPEQCTGEEDLDGRSDLYSVGVILWQMLTGRLPFSGRTVEVLGKHQFQPPPFAQLAGLPAPLIDLLTGLLVKDPSQRQPQTAGELRTALDRLLRALENLSPSVPAADLDDALETLVATSGRNTTEAPSIGTTLAASYRLGKEMGQGDGGRLFLAADNAAGQQTPVAIKLLPPERAADHDFLQKTAAALDLAARHPHPAILAHSSGLKTSGGATFYVREWAGGFSLLELLRGRGSLRAAEVFRLLNALPEALDFAAEEGFPHLEPALHKLFVTPATAAGNDEDWQGLRSRPVEDWPAFALKLNPLSFPPAIAAADAELTRVESRSASGEADPVVALARLTRELLGGAPESLAPLSALSGEANVVLQRALSPKGGKAAFKSCADLWHALRASADLEVAPTIAPEQGIAVEPVFSPPPNHAETRVCAPAPESAWKGRGKKALSWSLGLLLLIGAGFGAWKLAQLHSSFSSAPSRNVSPPFTVASVGESLAPAVIPASSPIVGIAPAPTPLPHIEALKQEKIQPLLVQARRHMAAAQWREAVEAYSQVLALKPDLLEALDERGAGYDSQGENDKAKADYTLVILQEPRDAREHYYRGDAYEALEQPGKARLDYQAALALEARDARDFFLRGLAYYGLQKYDLAIENFDEALRLDPKHALAFNHRGYAYNFLQKYDLAIKDYDEAIHLNPAYRQAYLNRASANLAIGRAEEAKKDEAIAKRLATR